MNKVIGFKQIKINIYIHSNTLIALLNFFCMVNSNNKTILLKTKTKKDEKATQMPKNIPGISDSFLQWSIFGSPYLHNCWCVTFRMLFWDSRDFNCPLCTYMHHLSWIAEIQRNSANSNEFIKPSAIFWMTLRYSIQDLCS